MASANLKLESQRKEYGRALLEMGAKNDELVVLDSDLSVSTRTADFGKAFPDRFFNCGVSEANMVATAAGLAMAGKTVFASTFAVFATGMTYNQIRQSIAYPSTNVKIAASHAGLSVGPDGATHQMFEDIGLMRGLPNMTVVVPADASQTYQATYALAAMKGPAYMRFGRADVPPVSDGHEPFRIGKASVLREGKDVSIIATGQLVHAALIASSMLAERGTDARVVNMSTIKPLDTGVILDCARKTGAIVTAEEHNVVNGLGDAVCAATSGGYPVPVRKLGLNDTFGESGQAEELMVRYGLTAEGIVDSVAKVMKIRQ